MRRFLFFCAIFTFISVDIVFAVSAEQALSSVPGGRPECFQYLASRGLKGENVNGQSMNINPEFACRLMEYFQELQMNGCNPHVLSGYRSPSKQRRVCGSRGKKNCAPPNTSCHQYGIAVDTTNTTVKNGCRAGTYQLLMKHKLVGGYKGPINDRSGTPGHLQCIEKMRAGCHRGDEQKCGGNPDPIPYGSEEDPQNPNDGAQGGGPQDGSSGGVPNEPEFYEEENVPKDEQPPIDDYEGLENDKGGDIEGEDTNKEPCVEGEEREGFGECAEGPIGQLLNDADGVEYLEEVEPVSVGDGGPEKEAEPEEEEFSIEDEFGNYDTEDESKKYPSGLVDYFYENYLSPDGNNNFFEGKNYQGDEKYGAARTGTPTKQMLDFVLSKYANQSQGVGLNLNWIGITFRAARSTATLLFPGVGSIL